MSDLEKIRARRREIVALRTILDEEDKELSTAERVLARLGSANSRIPAIADKPQSQRDYVLAALRDVKDPWFIAGSGNLQAHIEKIYGVTIPMTSLQPLIWSLTNKENLIKRDGRKIALASRVS